MDSELIFRISAGLIFFALTVIRIYYTVVVVRSASSFSINRLGSPRSFLAWFLYTFIIFLVLIYILAPRVSCCYSGCEDVHKLFHYFSEFCSHHGERVDRDPVPALWYFSSFDHPNRRADMLEKFGAKYRDDMQRTGFFLPRCRAKDK